MYNDNDNGRYCFQIPFEKLVNIVFRALNETNSNPAL